MTTIAAVKRIKISKMLTGQKDDSQSVSIAKTKENAIAIAAKL